MRVLHLSRDLFPFPFRSPCYVTNQANSTSAEHLTVAVTIATSHRSENGIAAKTASHRVDRDYHTRTIGSATGDGDGMKS